MGENHEGKNAGLPITRRRYVAGLLFFVGYHGAVALTLHAAAVPWSSLRPVRDFHRALALNDLREILARRDIAFARPGSSHRGPQAPVK